MRTPVVVVSGQDGTGDIARTLLGDGTALVEHCSLGDAVLRRTTLRTDGVEVTDETLLGLQHGCVSCTVRDDVVDQVAALHRRSGVARIVLLLSPWMEPEPVCFVLLGSPAARDVSIAGVVTAIDVSTWLSGALGEDELDDGRTVAQVHVGQVEFADVVVLDRPHPATLAVARRLAPRSRITVGTDRLAMALGNLDCDARRGRSDHPFAGLLAGQPPLHADGAVSLLQFESRHPLHPGRLYDALDLILEGVVRARGRVWTAGRHDHAMWLESAGGGYRVGDAGKWLAAMSSGEAAFIDPERRAMASLLWDEEAGDRHTSLVILVCGADPTVLTAALRRAELTDDEISRPWLWRHFEDPFGDWSTGEARLA